MNITRVSYGRTYSLGSFQSERIDLEASIDETRESVADAVFQLREYCDQLHKKNNPHLYQEQETIQPTPEWATHKSSASYSLGTQEITEKISPEQEIEDTLKGIEEATAETLPTFRIKASQNIKTLGAYNRRKKQLNIQ